MSNSSEVSMQRPWWRKPWVLALAIAVPLAVVAPFISNVTAQVSVVLGVLGATLALCIEQYLHVEDLRRDMRASAEQAEHLTSILASLSPIFLQRPLIREYMSDVATSLAAIESNSQDLLQQIASAMQADFREQMNNVASGVIELSSSEEFSFQYLPLDRVREINIVHISDLDYWRTGPAERYLGRQKASIRAGSLKVTRIFVLTRAEVEEAAPIVLQQVQSGVNVKIVVREDVPTAALGHVVHQGVITDADGTKLLVQPKYSTTAEVMTGLEKWSYLSRDVRLAEHSISVLNGYTRDVSEILPL